ncbi:MAG: YfhO family protein [Bacteroidetes bacterium]|nr:YfhO family protein [Bacteroidota bacterium]
MNKINWQKLYPHFVAIVLFVIVAVVYCKPALQGKVLQQGDLAQWVGMSKDQQNYMDSNGHAPLWTNGMFSGMPGYVILGYSNNYIAPYFIDLLSLFLPSPINFFFIACICFYFLAQVFKVNPWVSIIGALMYAYATYNPIIISVGHVTKMYSIAFMPGIIASIQLIFNKKYWAGAALTALFTAALAAENHYQIIYYSLIIIAFMGIAFIIQMVKEKNFKHLLTAVCFAVLAGLIGAATSAVSLLPNYEYSKETIRGGSDLIANTGDTTKPSTGLNEDYAFSYSLYKSEPFVMLVPRMFGGSSGNPELDQEKSKAIKALQEMPQEIAQQLGYPEYYWGGINGVGTAGPPYTGAIVCFLAIIGFVILENKYRWWILSCCILTIIMSWGGYFKSFNGLLLEYLPMYNKFRAPSMILVVPTLLLGLSATLALDKMIFHIKDKKTFIEKYKKALYIMVGIFAFLLFLYFSFDFVSQQDSYIMQQINKMEDQIKTPILNFLHALQDDRRTLYLNDLLRSLLFVAIGATMLWLFLKEKVKPNLVLLVIGTFSFIDLMAIDVKYLNSDQYIAKDDYENNFQPTKADQQIMQDKSFYRVLDLRHGGLSGAFNTGALTAYFHHSIGGYHPAKLSIYQDLIENQLMKFPNCLPVLNMLNTKYIITAEDIPQLNTAALGNAWFVPSVQYTSSPKETMDALSSFNPSQTVLVEQNFKNIIHQPVSFDSSASIQLMANRNDTVTYKSVSKVEMPAVFSEIYYSEGWNAYIDGKKTDYAKVDYVLRGLMVPAGNHQIEFRFEPASFALGWRITSISSIIIVLLIIMAFFIAFKKKSIK